MSTFTTEVFEKRRLVFLRRGFRWFGVGSSELGLTGLAVMNITEEVKVMVEEVWKREIQLARAIVSESLRVFFHIQSWVTLTSRFTRGFCSFSSSSAVKPRICTWRLPIGSVSRG